MEFFFGVPFESLVLIVFETYRSAYQPHSYWVFFGSFILAPSRSRGLRG